MKAQYKLNKDDYKAFNMYHHHQSPSTQKQYYRSWFMPIVWWLIIFTALWYFSLNEERSPMQGLKDLSPLLSFIPIYLIYYPLAFRRKLRKAIEAMLDEGHNIDLFGNKEVSISEAGIDTLSEYSSNSIKWPAIEKIVLFKKYIFIYQSAVEAIIIPSKAFASTEDFNSFYNSANTFWKS